MKIYLEICRKIILRDLRIGTLNEPVQREDCGGRPLIFIKFYIYNTR